MKKALGGLIGLLVALLIIFGGYIAYDNVFAGGEFTKTLFPDMFSEEEPEDNNSEDNNSEDDTVIIPEHEHEYSEELSFDETYHYKKCNVCNRIKGAEKHSFEWVIDSLETDSADGIKHEACVCGIKRNVETIIDDVYGSNDFEAPENWLDCKFTGDVDFNGTSCIYTDGNGATSDEQIEIGYVNEWLDTVINLSMRYTTVYKESDGSFTLNNNGMILKDANGNNLQLNGADWISLNYATPGFMIYDEEHNLYKVFLRMYPNSTNGLKYSIDVATMNGRYRLISEDINALCEDFLQCGYLDIDFGVANNYPNDYSYTYGFRFKTQNKEVSYVSNNSGTIKNEDEWFVCANVNSTSGEATNITNTSVLGWVARIGVFNSPQNCVLYALKGNSFYASVYTKDNTGSLLSVKNGSDWFQNLYSKQLWDISKSN